MKLESETFKPKTPRQKIVITNNSSNIYLTLLSIFLFLWVAHICLIALKISILARCSRCNEKET